MSSGAQRSRDIWLRTGYTFPYAARFLRYIPTCVGTPVGMTMGGFVAAFVGTPVRLGRALGRNDGREFGEYVGWAGFLPMRFGLRDIYFLYGKCSVVFG